VSAVAEQISQPVTQSRTKLQQESNAPFGPSLVQAKKETPEKDMTGDVAGGVIADLDFKRDFKTYKPGPPGQEANSDSGKSDTGNNYTTALKPGPGPVSKASVSKEDTGLTNTQQPLKPANKNSTKDMGADLEQMVRVPSADNGPGSMNKAGAGDNTVASQSKVTPAANKSDTGNKPGAGATGQQATPAVPGPETEKIAPPESAQPKATTADTGIPATPPSGAVTPGGGAPAGNNPGTTGTPQPVPGKQEPATTPAAAGNTPTGSTTSGSAPANAAGTAAVAAAGAAGPGEEAAADKATTSPSPQSDPAFNAVIANVQHTAIAKSAHPAAKTKEHEISAAAKGPASEVAGLAEGNQVQKISSQQPKPFDKEAFKAAVLQKIAQVMPKNLEEADEFKDKDKVSSVKPALNQQVKKDKEEAQGDIAHTTAEKPSGEGIKPKEVTPLKDMPVGPAPQVDGKGAVPKPKPDAEISTAAESKSMDDAYTKANVTSGQLQESNEPTFIDADNTKKSSQQKIEQSPGDFRKFEQGALSQAGKQSDAILHKGLGQMQGARHDDFSKVIARQNSGKANDEAVRAKVTADLQKIYTDSKAQVEARLHSLDATVNSLFDTGALSAKNAFENYVDKAIKDYKSKRYAGLDGKLQWLADKWNGMPAEVNNFYVAGRTIYEQEMGKTLDVIAATVERELVAATQLVAEGRKKVVQYIHDQPASVQKIAKEQGKGILSDFGKLEHTIADKQNEIIDALATKYSDKLKEVDDRIKQMKEANKGLATMIMEKVGGVIKTIMEMKSFLAGLLKKAMDIIGAIIAHPIKFLGNLIDAIGTGLKNFVANIGEHLKNGVFEWLMGAIPGGITLPKTWDLKGIFQLVMQVLGFTWGHIRGLAVTMMGEKMVKALETGFDIFVVIIRDGISGLWTYIMDKLGDLKSMVIDAIIGLLKTEVVEAGIKWLLGLLTPASAFLKACSLIIDIVKWFINNASRIADLISGILDSVGDIAAGNLGGAAKKVETSLKRIIPITIGFLAGILGIGDLSARVQGIIKKVTDPINKAIDWLLKKGYEYGKKFLDKITGKEGGEHHENDPEKQKKINDGIADLRNEEKNYLTSDKIKHEDAEKVAAIIKTKHPVFTSFKVKDDGKKWDYVYTASPEEKIDGHEKEEGTSPISYKPGDFIKARYVDAMWVAKITVINPSEVTVRFVDTRKGEKTHRLTDFAELVKNGQDIQPYIPGSNREFYMGGNPSRNSTVGDLIKEKLEKQDKYKNDPELIKFEGKWYKISDCDLSHHPVDAVTYWNKGDKIDGGKYEKPGKEYGPRHPIVREWMMDPKHYIFEPASSNRSRGARDNETYDLPFKADK